MILNSVAFIEIIFTLGQFSYGYINNYDVHNTINEKNDCPNGEYLIFRYLVLVPINMAQEKASE